MKDEFKVLFHEKVNLNSHKYWQIADKLGWTFSPFKNGNLEMTVKCTMLLNFNFIFILDIIYYHSYENR